MSLSMAKRQRGLLGESESASAKTAIIRRAPTSGDPLSSELLSGIVNEVTLNFIAPLLSWRDCQVLSTISRDWQRAFQMRMVNGARVHSQSTETFVVVLSWISTCHGDKYVNALGETRHTKFVKKLTLSLFSPREKRWNTLPRIPGCEEWVPSGGYEYVFLDGSMYFLGVNRSGDTDTFSAEVYVLDLAGHVLGWRRCADMQVPRRGYCVGVMHGKIFVFGGESQGTIDEVRNEMYDPKVDAWSWIAPIPTPLVTVDKVYSVGQEFFVIAGWMPNRPRPSGWVAFSDDQAEIDDEAEIRGDTKLVVRIGAARPKSIRTSDMNAEDDMDGLHEIIENELIHLMNPEGSLSSLHQFIAKYLLVGAIDAQQKFILTGKLAYGSQHLWAYDPVKDELRVFENKNLETENVHMVRRMDPSFQLGNYPGSLAYAWEVSL